MVRVQIKYVLVSIIIVSLYTVTSVPVVTRTDGSSSSGPQTRIMFVRDSVDPDRVPVAPDIPMQTMYVYNYALNILVHKMQSWLNGQDPIETISKYLGFSQEIIDIVNAAITILFETERDTKQPMKIDNLTAAFLYSCDIEYMRPGGAAERSRSDVGENFRRIIKNLRVDAQQVVVKYRQYEIANELKKYVTSYPKPVNPWYGVSIQLLKNRMFREETGDATVNRLKGRFAPEYWTTEAETHETETDANIVIENHIKFIGKIIPDLFGFAYNHVELMTRLSGHELRELREVSCITASSAHFIAIIQILIRRYFVFRKVPGGQLFQYGITPLKKFFIPDVNRNNEGLTILDYRKPGFEMTAWALTNKALDLILVTFVNEKPKQWKDNRTIRVDYPQGNVSKTQLLDLIRRNNRDADAFHELLLKYGVKNIV